MGRNKRFAKNSEGVRHFKLVSRSQNDGDIEDPNATPLVLEPYVRPGDKKRTGLSEPELLEIPESLEKLGPEVFGLNLGAGQNTTEQQGLASLEEGDEDDEDFDDQAEMDGDCYFPRDGYNYEQHLKRVSGVGKKGGVVGVVMAAPAAPDVKYFKQQPSQTTEQSEVLRCLEQADVYDELSDGDLDAFLPSGVAEDSDVLLFGPTAVEFRDVVDIEAIRKAHKEAIGGLRFAAGDEDGAGEFYGDDDELEDFDDFLAGEYGKEEFGAIDDEEIEGHLNAEACEEAVEEYLEDKAAEQQMLRSVNEPIKGKYDDVPRVIEETKAIIEKHYYTIAEDEEETSSGEDDTDDSRQWDCESVLSTLSNLSNRPGKIGKIKVVGKPKPKALPRVGEEGDEEGSDKEDANAEDDTESVIELPDVITERKKDETPEERRARKASVKEMRRVCRRMKKESKEMYKNEAAKLPGQKATLDLKSGQRYQKL